LKEKMERLQEKGRQSREESMYRGLSKEERKQVSRSYRSGLVSGRMSEARKLAGREARGETGLGYGFSQFGKSFIQRQRSSHRGTRRKSKASGQFPAGRGGMFVYVPQQQARRRKSRPNNRSFGSRFRGGPSLMDY